MKGSVVYVFPEGGRPLNSISLQNAVLCADCDVVSDSPHDHCLVCGSRSLLNLSCLLGGMLPSRRATVTDAASRPSTLLRAVLEFPRTPRLFKLSDHAKQKRDGSSDTNEQASNQNRVLRTVTSRVTRG